jgi:hypothetical protein
MSPVQRPVEIATRAFLTDEYACHEGTTRMRNILSGVRADERK